MPDLWPLKHWIRGIKTLGHDYASDHAAGTVHEAQVFELDRLDPADRRRNEAVIRGRCQSAYLGGTDSLCWALGRYRMVVDTADAGLSSILLLDGFWEMWVTEAFAPRVKPGMTVVDCGANLGYYTLIAADQVGAGGHVHAIEPNPAMARRLRRSLIPNGLSSRVTMHETALADGDGETRLRVPADEPKNAHLAAAAGEGDALYDVPVRRLDGLLGTLDVDLVKIDVEGAEQQLWRGMTGLLERPRPLTVFLEFTTDRYADPAGFLDEVLRYGFRLEIVSYTDGVRPITRAEVLAAASSIDQMLLLTR